jgi:hypothetical protein
VPDRPTSLRLAPEVAELLERLAALRGASKTAIIVTGILAQAELFGLIPSLTELLGKVMPELKTEPEVRRRQRLSQRRSRARRKGEPVPKLKPGRPRQTPIP